MLGRGDAWIQRTEVHMLSCLFRRTAFYTFTLSQVVVRAVAIIFAALPTLTF